MRTIAQIFADAPSIQNILPQHDHYFAHSTDGKAHKRDEWFYEHVELVNTFVERLCHAHGLDAVIDAMIGAVVRSVSALEEVDGDAIKERFAYSFLFHDFGKINPNFQREKMKKWDLFPHKAIVPFLPDTGHSELSAYCYLRYYAPKDSSDKSWILFYLTLLLSYPIIRHHAPNLWEIGAYFKDRKIVWNDKAAAFEQLRQTYTLEDGGDANLFQCWLQKFEDIQAIGEQLTKDCAMELHSLIKLNFSLLTASDFLATSVYANDKDYTLYGVMDAAAKARVVVSAQQSTPYNKAIFAAADDNNFVFDNPTLPGNEALNQLRLEMGVQVVRQLRNHADRRVFSIEAPTGGGKTNLSMLATAELLHIKPELNKVIYVFPFTTLVTQTHKAVLRTLGLSEDEVTQLHSKAGYRQMNAEGDSDGRYGDEKQDYLTYLFNHFPVTLCTHVRFFDWLTTPQKESNYGYHRLANSIVVIDELQAYSPKHWDKVILFVAHFAKYFNTHFIIMSATLPKLETLLPRLGGMDVAMCALLPDAKEQYFRNPNFRHRVHFVSDYLSENMTTERLAELVVLEARQYADNHDGSVYCIVECIFKRTATELFMCISDLPLFFDHVWVLSGTILEHRRRLIINRLKNKAYRQKRILLITTQVVEAGVDIDMDIGFKDQSILDSDEQLAGRINRNVNKPTCKLFLFRKDRASILYKNDLRYQISRDELRPSEITRILQEKDFDALYNPVIDRIVRGNESTLNPGHKAYLYELEKLDFQKIQREFRLIENDNLSLFVPLCLPLCVEDEQGQMNDVLISEADAVFLRRHGIAVTNMVNGEDVFDLFLRMVNKQMPDEGYIRNKTDFIRLRGVMSKFIFSMFASDKFQNKIMPFLDMEKSENGYLYLSQWQDIYDEKTGLSDAALDDVTHQIIG